MIDKWSREQTEMQLDILLTEIKTEDPDIYALVQKLDPHLVRGLIIKGMGQGIKIASAMYTKAKNEVVDSFSSDDEDDTNGGGDTGC